MSRPSPSHPSPRLSFQWHYILQAPEVDPPDVLNIGCADDPLKFGELAWHFDLDDWSAYHKYFTQGDAHDLPFSNERWDVVILGDVLEHVLNPVKAMKEALRVCRRIFVTTIFEEWKLPGPGQWIKEAQINSDEASRKLGYEDREDYQLKVYPKRIGVSDDDVPHLIHINQFTDQDIFDLVASAVNYEGFTLIQFTKAPEQIGDDGHVWCNWLIAMERVR